MVRAVRLLVGALLMAVLTHAPASTLRCENGVIRVGDDQAVVLQVCGPPAASSIRSEKVVSVNRIGINVSRVTEVETWIYDRGPGRFQQILDFAAGVLVNIQRGRRSGD